MAKPGKITRRELRRRAEAGDPWALGEIEKMGADVRELDRQRSQALRGLTEAAKRDLRPVIEQAREDREAATRRERAMLYLTAAGVIVAVAAFVVAIIALGRT